MGLELLIRQNPQYNRQGKLITFVGTSPYNLVPVTFILETARQWENYNDFIDVTEYVSDLHALKLTFSIDRDSTGNSTPGSDQLRKSVSGTLTFEKKAYFLIKQWLIDDVSAALNSVEVLIRDTSCGDYVGYIIRPSELQFCQDGDCTFSVNLKQQDEALNCIKRTLIHDNWQGWFQKVPVNGKKHPRFSYCVEQRPNGMMIMMWWLAGVVMMPTLLVMIPIVLLVNSIVFAINGIIAIINAIADLLGTGTGNAIEPITFINLNDLLDSFAQYYVESAGCGREHPSPLIRDYISNVCDYCGIEVDNVTAPIFFSNTLTINTSSRGLVTQSNPYYNACYSYPQVKRGIRRFRSLNIFGASPRNDTEFWIPENAPLLTLDMFLDQIKGMYNAEWRVKNGKLYFWRKDWFNLDGYLYDFTDNHPDRLKILEGICFEPNELKYPAYCAGIYQTDPSDMNEAGGANGTGQMNGIVSFGNIDNNPNFEGILDKTQPFGSTKFNLDGASGCYYYDAMQVVVNGAIFTPFAPAQMAIVSGAFREYADYALLMQGETCALPKIIIWSGDSYTNAKAIKTKSVNSAIAPQPEPTINTVYNKDNQTWFARHEPDTFVIGGNLSGSNNNTGLYRVTDYFGIVITQNPAILCNYPMYFEPFYQDTLWDLFHWIDDPINNPVMNFNYRVKIGLCCEDLEKLGVLNDGNAIPFGQLIKLPFGYYQDGKLREVTVSYGTSEEYGQYIELSGNL